MSCNKTRDLILFATAVSKFSKTPLLLIGNPGVAKTTIEESYVDYINGFMFTLIGSQCCKEEVGGYQVKEDPIYQRNQDGSFALDANGKIICLQPGRLVYYDPVYFDLLWEADRKGIPTVLFLDEISTCGEDVQGSLLKLIFDRTVASGRKLPDSTLIIAGANYYDNLPMQYNIMAPTVNRFMVVNIQFDKAVDFVNEFMQDPEERLENWPVFTYEPISTEQKATIKDSTAEMFITLFGQYALKEKGKGCLNANNQRLNELYTNASSLFENAPVLNFISGRTMYYTKKLAETLVGMNLDKTDKELKANIINILHGLVGAGTLCFKTIKEYKSYQDALDDMFLAIIGLKKSARIKAEFNCDIINTPLGELVGKFIFWTEQRGANIFDENLAKVYERVYNELMPDAGKMKRWLVDEKLQELLNALQQTEALRMMLKNSANIPEGIMNNLEAIHTGWETYLDMLNGSM